MLVHCSLKPIKADVYFVFDSKKYLVAEGKQVQVFKWSPSGSSFAYVTENDLYYQKDPTQNPIRITHDGKLHTIFNGYTDWVYGSKKFDKYHTP